MRSKMLLEAETLRSASETRPAARNRSRSMPSVDTRRQPPTGSMVRCACAPEIKRALCSRTEQIRIRQLYSASSHPPAARVACFDHSAHPSELAMPATADIRCEAPVEQSMSWRDSFGRNQDICTRQTRRRRRMRAHARACARAHRANGTAEALSSSFIIISCSSCTSDNNGRMRTRIKELKG